MILDHNTSNIKMAQFIRQKCSTRFNPVDYALFQANQVLANKHLHHRWLRIVDILKE